MSLAADRHLVGSKSTASETIAVSTSMRPLSLRINFSWILAGNVVRAVCRYAMLFLLLHFCGKVATARYVIAIAVCNPTWAFVMLGLRGAQITDARREYSFADYLAVRALASGAGLLVVAGAVLCGGYSVQATSIIVLVALAKLIEGISDIFRGRVQQQERMDRIAIALFIQGLSGLTLMAIAGYLGADVTLVVATFPAAMALTLLFWDLPCYAEIAREDPSDAGSWRQPLRWTTLARLSVVALPLAVVGFLIALIPQLPKYYIAAILGEESVTIYTILGYWITLGLMVVAALGNAAAPRMAKYHAACDTRAFARLLVRLVAIVGGMGIAGTLLVALAAPKLAIALGYGHSELPRLAVALSIFATTLYVTAPLGRALSAMRKFWWQTSAMATGIVVAMALLPWAVRVRGMVGAAEAMAISMGIVALISAGLVWFELSRHVRRESHSLKEAA